MNWDDVQGLGTVVAFVAFSFAMFQAGVNAGILEGKEQGFAEDRYWERESYGE